MAKRMTDSEKWGKQWFRLLRPKLKCMWEYLRDNCDLAGIWSEDYGLASFQIGDDITWEEVREAFGDRVVRIAKDKIFLPGFIEFQYGELSEECKPHLAAIKALRKHGIDPVTLTLSQEKQTLTPETPTDPKGSVTLTEGFAKGSDTLKDKDKDQDKEKDQDKDFEKEGLGEKTLTQSSENADPPLPKKSKPARESNLPELAELWNELADERLPKIREMAHNSARRTSCEKRWEERPDRAYWTSVIAKINATPFCLGTNNRGWKADIEFLTRPDNHAKILEGKYDWGTPKQNGVAGRVKTTHERTESLDAEINAMMSEVQQ